jgi:hypothetical protein
MQGCPKGDKAACREQQRCGNAKRRVQGQRVQLWGRGPHADVSWEPDGAVVMMVVMMMTTTTIIISSAIPTHHVVICKLQYRDDFLRISTDVGARNAAGPALTVSLKTPYQ